MIELRGIRKSFQRYLVLRDIDLLAVRGQITGIIGPNSCGKTTMVKTVLGLVLPDAGEIFFEGKPVARSVDYRARIGYMPQSTAFPENLSVAEIFMLLEELRGTPAVRKKALLEELGLGAFLNRPFGVLSGGTRQRVGAAVAMMFDPEVLILDEPTASLDPLAALQVRNMILREHQMGKTVLLISHLLSEVETLAQRLVFMLEGQVLFQGELEAFLRSAEASSLERAVVAHLQASTKDKS